MRLDSSGRLGIGTTSAAATLDVFGNQLFSAANPQIQFNASGPIIRLPSANTIAFLTDSTTERMRIDSSGRLLVGTSSAVVSESSIGATSSGNTCAFKTTGSATGTSPLLIHHAATTDDNRFIAFGTESSFTERGVITYNRGSGVVAYNTTSDYRAKTLLGGVENPGQTIDALKVYRGVMNGATVERPMLVAHEAQEVAPYCVTGKKDAVDDDGNPIYQQMDHQVLVPLLIAELQQLRARVAALEPAAPQK